MQMFSSIDRNNRDRQGGGGGGGSGGFDRRDNQRGGNFNRRNDGGGRGGGGGNNNMRLAIKFYCSYYKNIRLFIYNRKLITKSFVFHRNTEIVIVTVS